METTMHDKMETDMTWRLEWGLTVDTEGNFLRPPFCGCGAHPVTVIL